jgi:pyruvate/2-oxoglutarate dehydrogenase complex dihydrolipoamide dehydrogenase (E3) component
MSDLYNLVVIGAGAAGLTASAFIGEAGGKVALIEKNKLGGDCTWVGCVPSKALLKVAKVAHEMRTADTYGNKACEPDIDMTQVKAYVQQTIQTIYAHETPDVFSKRGVEVIEGHGKFVDAHTVQVGERKLHSRKFVIASGARPAVPPIPGLDDVPYHTNETLFENERLPQHLIVIGAGAIGMEMAQAYSRLGAEVTVIGEQIMPRDDHDARGLMCELFRREGITVIEGRVTQAAQQDDTTVITLETGETLQGDMLLVAVGRTPNVEGLGLDKAGVAYGRDGIHVNQHLQTNVPHIYAAGDCTPGPRLTHYAGFQASNAALNTLIPGINYFKGETDVFPWCTFTDPEVAQVGLTEEAARQQHGDKVKVFHFSLEEGDRAVAENASEGFIKLVYTGRSKLLGATVVAPRAGEMIQELTHAMTLHSLSDLTSTIHAYPTYSDIVKKAVSRMTIDELFKGTSGKLVDIAAKILF